MALSWTPLPWSQDTHVHIQFDVLVGDEGQRSQGELHRPQRPKGHQACRKEGRQYDLNPATRNNPPSSTEHLGILTFYPELIGCCYHPTYLVDVHSLRPHKVTKPVFLFLGLL